MNPTPLVPFGELLLEPVRNGIYKPPMFHGSGSKIVNMGELFRYPRLGDVEMRRVETTSDEKRRFEIRSGDLLFARRSLVAEGAGKCALVQDVHESTVFESSLIRARPNPELVSSDYLYYFFSSPQGFESLQSILRQVAVSGITGKDLSLLRVPVPSLDVQGRIAAILGSLDDKIELNLKMNETLEAMARAIFQSWFVDFDPVRVKARGGDPTAELGLAPEIAALFPDSLQDSELGEIPLGWQTTSVENVCSRVVRGVTPIYEEGSKRFIVNQRTNRGPELSFADLKELSPSLDVPSDKFARKWDVLVNCLGEGTLGRVHLFRFNENEWAVDQHMTICRPKSPQQGMVLYCYLSSPEGQERIESSKSGSTGMTMFNISKLRDFVVPAVPDELVTVFGQQVAGLFERQNQNAKEALTLAETRDYLLPLLLSGKVDVSTGGKP